MQIAKRNKGLGASFREGIKLLRRSADRSTELTTKPLVAGQLRGINPSGYEISHIATI
ncbi:MAG: hypothetical protein HUU08_02755 [Candidatus Brocadia sp.]|nr:hypothetical protein [Candidatus Brocadia sp.]